MHRTELQKILKREPFRAFGVRVSSGQVYEFMEPRDLGAPRKLQFTLYHFGTETATLIDVDAITEVFNV